jgi:hypothetical protein
MMPAISVIIPTCDRVSSLFTYHGFPEEHWRRKYGRRKYEEIRLPPTHMSAPPIC